MASPIGHALLGFAIARAGDRRPLSETTLLVAGCAFMAVAPDLDFLAGLAVGKPALYHQGPSHSFAFAGVAALLPALCLFREPSARLRAWALFAAAYASHLGLDLLGPDGRPPQGIPLFWPLSDQTFLSPRALLPGIIHAASSQSGTAEWLDAVISWHNLKAIVAEVVLVAPFVAAAELLRRQGGRAAASTRGDAPARPRSA